MPKVPVVATYALLLVLGVLEGIIGSFQYSRGPAPLAAIVFCLLLVATCLLPAWAMRSTLAALIPALGWIIAAYVLSLPTPGGSVIITNTTAGKWYLYGGTLCAAIAVTAAFRLWLGHQRRSSLSPDHIPARVPTAYRPASRIHLLAGERHRQHGAMAERFDVSRNGAGLAGERWPGGGQTVVLLHEGIADRRGWEEVAALLAPKLTVVAYDRRGHGQTPASTQPFSHLDDLLAVLDYAGAGPVWLVGASAGGGLALDAALVAPHRVAGLVVMAPAVSGAPEPELDADTKRFELLLDEAYAAGDAEEINRLETWLWLDGPGQPEGRVGGAARKLALDMNAVIIAHAVPETEGGAGVDAWHRLAEIKVPVTVACGDLDLPFLVDRCRLLADRLPAARYHVLTGMAHQPYLESASAVAQLIRSAVTEG